MEFHFINFSYFIEQKTLSGDASAPDRPDFVWEQLPSDNGYVPIRVNWMPNVNGRPGSHFFVKYRIKGETTWLDTDYEFNNDYVIIPGLQPDTDYEFAVISVDGEHMTESLTQDVQTVGIGMYFGNAEKRSTFFCLNKLNGVFILAKNRWSEQNSTGRCSCRWLVDRNAVSHRVIVVAAHPCVHY